MCESYCLVYRKYTCMFIVSRWKLPSQNTVWESLPFSSLNDAVCTAEMSHHALPCDCVQSL